MFVPVPVPGIPSPAGPCEIFEKINELRKKNNIAPLVFDSRLQDAAIKHAADMAQRKYFSHISPDGENVDDRVIREGYEWRIVAENIAAGYDNAEDLVNGWESSPGHFRNILCDSCKNTGIAGYYDNNSPWKYYYVQVFATTNQNIIPPAFNCNPNSPKPSPQPDCITNSGPSSGKKCIFPFIYRGDTYTKCIRINGQSDRSWCSTKVDSNNRHIGGEGNWGYCDDNCETTIFSCLPWELWCKDNKNTILGNPYLPVHIKIPSLMMTDIPHIEEDYIHNNDDKNNNNNNDDKDQT